VEERGLRQVTDRGAIEAAAKAGAGSQRRQGRRIPRGKEKLFGFFVGQVMKAMAGKGNPALVNDVLKKLLG
jgi:aspartyl-tRNA(Asn)/glutamyl-tRNA(Gln) amidotransferase subunit B